MKLLFQHSLAAVFFGFFPFGVFYTAGSERPAWFLSSALLAVFLAFEFIKTALLVKRVTPRRPLALYLHFFPFTLVALGLQLFNLRWSSSWPYFWGIFWLLQPPAVQFYHYISFLDVTDQQPQKTGA